MKNKDAMVTKQEMINRKRKFTEPEQEEDRVHDQQRNIPPPPPPPGMPQQPPSSLPPAEKSETIPAPFPWATTRRASIRSLADLESQEISTITGDVECMACKRRGEIKYDLKGKFNEVGDFIANNKHTMKSRAPKEWFDPVLPTCQLCEIKGNRLKPVIAEKKKEINWLFLLLGQMIESCSVKQLRYFCKHTNNHRPSTKDRLLYLTYLGLCKQLLPSGPFDMGLSAVPPPARRRPRAVRETILAPFSWATTYRATIHSLADLESQEIFTITGDVECMTCKGHSEIEYDLKEKFNEVSGFIINNRDTMHGQAPNKWLNPGFPICKLCETPGNIVKPVIAKKKKDINWLFLLLGQMIGCCYVPQLKYFCKHTNNHRPRAKGRLLYLTYLGLCKQLQPNGPFDP